MCIDVCLGRQPGSVRSGPNRPAIFSSLNNFYFKMHNLYALQKDCYEFVLILIVEKIRQVLRLLASYFGPTVHSILAKKKLDRVTTTRRLATEGVTK